MGASHGEQNNTQTCSRKKKKSLLFYCYLESTHSNLLRWKRKGKISENTNSFQKNRCHFPSNVYVSFSNFCISYIYIYNQSYVYRYMGIRHTFVRKPLSQNLWRACPFSSWKIPTGIFLDHATVSFLWVRLWWQVRILVKEDFPLVLDFFFNFFWFFSEIPSSSMMALKERH